MSQPKEGIVHVVVMEQQPEEQPCGCWSAFLRLFRRNKKGKKTGARNTSCCWSAFLRLFRRNKKDKKTGARNTVFVSDVKEDEGHATESPTDEQTGIKENVEEEKEAELHVEDEHTLTKVEEENAYKFQNENVEEFLGRHVLFMTEEQLHSLGTGRPLGEGGFGSVKQVMYDGSDVIVKELLDDEELEPLFKEARVMVELDGAGGVPQLKAVCPSPPALVQEFVGKTYAKLLAKCSVGEFLKSLISITERLGEVHAKGYVHNDLKIDNVTFSGSVCEPVFHIIDLGWACRVGQVVVDEEKAQRVKEMREEKKKAKYILNLDSSNDSDEMAQWMAPEVLGGGPVLPSGDVYSFGFLLDCVLMDTEQTFLKEPLKKLQDLCTVCEPSGRLTLTQVAQGIMDLSEHLTPEQRSQTFTFEED